MMDFVLTVIFRTSVLFLGSAFLSLLLRRAAAATRHAFWALAMAGGIALPIAAMLLPRLDVPILETSAEVSSAVSSSTSITALTVRPAQRGAEPSQQTEPSTSSTPAQRFQWPWRQALFVIWALGATLVFSRFIRSRRYYDRLARAGTSTSEDVYAAAAAIKERLFILRNVRIVRVDEHIPPMTCGFLRHVILVPTCSDEWSAERKMVVLAHELAHVRRRDGLFQILDRINCSIYWFNPLVWLASRQIHLERERACDDAVLRLGVNANDYAGHLFDIAKCINWNRLQADAVMSMAQASQLETRLRSIVDYSRSRSELSLRMKGVLLGTALVSIAPLATMHLTAFPLPVRMEPFGYITPLVAPVMRSAELTTSRGARSAAHEVTSPFAADFVAILPGTFLMGCGGPREGCTDPDVPPHLVRITKSFEMGRYEVTQEQWQAVTEKNPSDFGGPNLPVEQVSWNDIQEFLSALNARNDGFRYRLPTEAEWEYAARAGEPVNWVSGPRIPAISGLDALADVAWTGRNSDGHTHPVGQKKPNEWGLYDMFGNVAELTADWFQEGYDTNTSNDPQGPATGFGHVVRGGSWDLPFSPRLRYDAGADAKFDFIGFRLVREGQAARTQPQSPLRPANTPKWEVISVKPCPSTARQGRGSPDITHGRLNVPCFTTAQLIWWAYEFFASGEDFVGIFPPEDHRIPIVGAPSWVSSELYTITAKAESTPKPSMMVGPMLQVVLEDRFHLAIYRRMTTSSVYELTVAKGGLKINPLETSSCITLGEWRESFDPNLPIPAPPVLCGGGGLRKMPDGTANLDLRTATMGEYANLFRLTELDLPVIDKTAINGLFNFHLVYSPEQTVPSGEPVGPNIFTALQEQLGLKLSKAKGLVPTLVIDHIDRPTSN